MTRRLVSEKVRSPWYVGGCRLKVGRTYAVCPGRGERAVGRLQVVSVTKVVLGRLDVREARREGFGSVRDFEHAWRVINGCYDPESVVWRIRFFAAEVGPQDTVIQLPAGTS